MDKKNYRRGVGMIIMNKDSQFWLGKRINTEAWQFPQGGIDKGESVREAMYRELQEETGLNQEAVEIVSISKRWLVYHIPHVFQRHNKKFDGAMQKWYLLKLTGAESSINLNATGHAEFDDWKWGDRETAIKSVIKFKRDVYKSIFKEFKDVLERRDND
tara:strand:+ start:1086 stop:1562 length:477 start_codon:yes stop_codon:yes gene_type:complete